MLQFSDVLNSSPSPAMYPEMWRPATPDRSEISSRSSHDLNVGSGGAFGQVQPGPNDDGENYTNVLTFSPTYK